MSIKYSLDRNQQQDLCKEIPQNLYVDNMSLLADHIETAFQKHHESKLIFENMSMNSISF